MHYDFIRPVHYEKIEFAKGSTSVNAKILKRQMIEEFTRQKVEHQRTLSLDTSTSNQEPAVEFSLLCEHLADYGHLSVQTDLASAFYCMLINCNENKLYMKNNSHRDDLFIQERPFLDQRQLSTLSYSYSSSSNLSVSSLSTHWYRLFRCLCNLRIVVLLLPFFFLKKRTEDESRGKQFWTFMGLYTANSKDLFQWG